MPKSFRKTYKIRRKTSIFKNRFFLFGIVFLFLILGIFYLIYLAPFFQIKEINISGCQKVQSQELETAIKAKIVKKIAFFDTQSIFLINSEKITEEILKNFPEIETIVFEKKIPDNLIVFVKKRDPVALLCQNDNCFYIDKNGIAYEETFEKNYQGPKIDNQLLLAEIKLGQTVVGGDLIGQILKINSELSENLKIVVKNFNIVSEQRLNVKIVAGWEIYFNLKGDLDWQITELKTILENKILPKNWKNLAYIDLRFDLVFVSPEGLMEN
jgi:cell division protein FtsQ